MRYPHGHTLTLPPQKIRACGGCTSRFVHLAEYCWSLAVTTHANLVWLADFIPFTWWEAREQKLPFPLHEALCVILEAGNLILRFFILEGYLHCSISTSFPLPQSIQFSLHRCVVHDSLSNTVRDFPPSSRLPRLVSCLEPSARGHAALSLFYKGTDPSNHAAPVGRILPPSAQAPGRPRRQSRVCCVRMDGPASGFSAYVGAGAAPVGVGLPFALPQHSELDQVSVGGSLTVVVDVAPPLYNVRR